MTPKQAHDITRDNAGNAIGQATGNVKTATDAGPAGTSYQLSADLLATRTTGQWRKNNILSRLDEADPEDHFFSSTLPVEMRDYQSSLHPWLMGASTYQNFTQRR